ncbi:MAG: DNA polymerase III subunit chi [Gammaproteobacteria bacterium]
MPRVDFYVLPENSSAERFACTIANKAWQQGHTVYFETASREAAGVMDDLLWTFNDISFLPHVVAEDGGTPAERVVIGWQKRPPENYEVLINLTAEIPAAAEGFARIVEIVAGDQRQRDQARNRYRGYREQGYELHNHMLKSDHDHT